MNTSNEELFLALKKILKAKKILYKDLVEPLQISEAAVKKMFVTQDCSIRRLTEICNAVDISVSDLFEATKKAPIKTVVLSSSQSQFLAANPHYLNFFNKLAFEKRTLAEIIKQHRLTEKSVRKYLKKLEELQLLEVHPKDRIKIKITELSKVKLNNPQISENRKNDVLRFIKGIDAKDPAQVFGTMHFKFTPASLQKFRVELFELVDRYYLRSNVEQGLFDNKDLEELNFVLAMASHSFIGEIINLE